MTYINAPACVPCCPGFGWVCQSQCSYVTATTIYAYDMSPPSLPYLGCTYTPTPLIFNPATLSWIGYGIYYPQSAQHFDWILHEIFCQNVAHVLYSNIGRFIGCGPSNFLPGVGSLSSVVCNPFSATRSIIQYSTIAPSQPMTPYGCTIPTNLIATINLTGSLGVSYNGDVALTKVAPLVWRGSIATPQGPANVAFGSLASPCRTFDPVDVVYGITIVDPFSACATFCIADQLPRSLYVCNPFQVEFGHVPHPSPGFGFGTIRVHT